MMVGETHYCIRYQYHTMLIAIGTDLLLKHEEVLCKHKQSNKDLKKYALPAAYPEKCVSF